MEPMNNKDLLYFYYQGESPYLKFDMYTHSDISKVLCQRSNIVTKYIIAP